MGNIVFINIFARIEKLFIQLTSGTTHSCFILTQIYCYEEN